MDFLAAALGGAGAEAGVFELGDGGGLLEVGEGVGVVDDVFVVEGEGGVGELVEGGFPGGEDLAGEVGGVGSVGWRSGLWCAWLAACWRMASGRARASREAAIISSRLRSARTDVGVLPVEDFALLGDAELAGEAVDGLGEDGAVGGAAAAAYGSSAAVEEAQGDAAVAGYLVEGAVGFVDLPGAGDHAAVFVGVGVAEHDLLLVVPGFEQRLVGIAGPELRA